MRVHPRANIRVRDGNFSVDGLVDFGLSGSTFGIVGLGQIGRAVFSNDILGKGALPRLLTSPNVLMGSHMAFLTREALREIVDTTVACPTAFAAGQTLRQALH